MRGDPSATTGGRGASTSATEPPQQSLRDMLADALEGLATDPEAGDWAEWARSMLDAGQADEPHHATEQPAATDPEPGDWRPRKPR